MCHKDDFFGLGAYKSADILKLDNLDDAISITSEYNKKKLIRLCSCHVQADLPMFRSWFSFDYMKAGER